MTRVQPNAQWTYICGKGDDDGRPYVALIDADGAIITAGGDVYVDAADVTYTPTIPADWDGGVDPGNQDAANDQLAERVKDIEFSIGKYPIRFFIPYNFCRVTVGNTFLVAVNTSYLFALMCYQNTPANGDTVCYSAFLDTGNYTLHVIHGTNTNRGKIDIFFKYIDDADYTTIQVGKDMYSNPEVVTNNSTFAFTVVTAGVQLFKHVVNGKNGASSDYYIVVNAIAIYKATGVG